MKGPEAPARAALAAVIRKDIATVERLTGTLQVLPAGAGYSDAAAQGYTLHNIYCIDRGAENRKRRLHFCAVQEGNLEDVYHA
jgi:hypothetical protein